MQHASRIPLCPGCLHPPELLAAEFFCSGCGTPFENAFPLDAEGRCALCRHGLRGFHAAYCYGPYEGLLRERIHLYKHGCVKTMAGPLIELRTAALPRHEHLDCVVPVPLHWQRGFNQAELLARGIARKWHLPVISAPRRLRHTTTQTGLSNAARRKNVFAAFACRRSLPGRRVLLVDDVLTTGSTAAACAAALGRSGVRRVVLLTADRRLAAPYAATADFHSEEIPNHG